MLENIGITAGTIWKYLDENGPTTVAKLIRETKVDEKTIQRGIGWLAQEGKVSIEVVSRAETIALV
jgi:DeoR/GlpR family transcriptional regulator of sugar metabolism